MSLTVAAYIAEGVSGPADCQEHHRNFWACHVGLKFRDGLDLVRSDPDQLLEAKCRLQCVKRIGARFASQQNDGFPTEQSSRPVKLLPIRRGLQLIFILLFGL